MNLKLSIVVAAIVATTPMYNLSTCNPGEDTPTPVPVDADGDGYSTADDCNDGDNTIHPGVEDSCQGDGVDQDCSGVADDGVLLYADLDGDHFGDRSFSTHLCSLPPSGYSANSLDCKDDVSSTNPNAADVEIDGIDQDCNGVDGPDSDRDGTTDTTDDDGDRYTEQQGDCSDSDPRFSPDAIDDVSNGSAIDYNCDGLVNVPIATTAPTRWLVRLAGNHRVDLYFPPGSVTASEALAHGGTATALDLEIKLSDLNERQPQLEDDNHTRVAPYIEYSPSLQFSNPTKPEATYYFDNSFIHFASNVTCSDVGVYMVDSNGETDGGPMVMAGEGCTLSQSDSDEGSVTVVHSHFSTYMVAIGAGHTNFEPRYAAGMESVEIASDDECSIFAWNYSGTAGEVTEPFYVNAVNTPQGVSFTYTAQKPTPQCGTDAQGQSLCNESDPAEYYTLDMQFLNRNATTQSLELVVYMEGSESSAAQCRFQLASGAVVDYCGTHCSNPPDDVEQLNQLLGTPCTGNICQYDFSTVLFDCITVDVLPDPCSIDLDGDGNKTCQDKDCTANDGIVNPDCDDKDSTVYYGAKEVCDGKDNDCSGKIDDGPSVPWYQDVDGDGYGQASKTMQSFCQPGGYARLAGDCNDGEASIHPGGVELCNGIDDDCTGKVDEQCPESYAIAPIAAHESWSNYDEESSHTFACAANHVWVARVHSGDENGPTSYVQTDLTVLNAADFGNLDVAVTSPSYYTQVKESSGTWVNAPANKILTGRSHYGDENENTSYYVSTVSVRGLSAAVVDIVTSGPYKESSGVYFECPDSRVMTGRFHYGDENGDTYYRCGRLTIDLTP